MLDDSALMQWSRLHFPKLQQLSFHYACMESPAAFMQFCGVVSGTLELLNITVNWSQEEEDSMNSSPSSITNHTVKQIAMVCHKLKVVGFCGNIDVDLHCLSDLVAGCPDIHTALLPRSQHVTFINGRPFLGNLVLDHQAKGLKKCT